MLWELVGGTQKSAFYVWHSGSCRSGSSSSKSSSFHCFLLMQMVKGKWRKGRRRSITGGSGTVRM